MSCMRDVRKRAERTDGSFEPLRETVGALTGAGVALPDGVLRQVGGGVFRLRLCNLLHTCVFAAVCALTAALRQLPNSNTQARRAQTHANKHAQLENAEVRWKALKKKILNRREALAALQQAEAVDVRRKSDAFAERVEEYRK